MAYRPVAGFRLSGGVQIFGRVGYAVENFLLTSHDDQAFQAVRCHRRSDSGLDQINLNRPPG